METGNSARLTVKSCGIHDYDPSTVGAVSLIFGKSRNCNKTLRKFFSVMQVDVEKTVLASIKHECFSVLFVK